MALVVFLRGINVGAAGTLVVRKPGSRAKFRAELRVKLPCDAIVASCNAAIGFGSQRTTRFALSRRMRTWSDS